MSTRVKNSVVFFSLGLDAFTVGTNVFLFVVMLYAVLTAAAAFLIGQSDAIGIMGGLQPDATLLFVARIATDWPSIIAFCAFVLVTHTKEGKVQREVINDLIALALGVGAMQLGYNLGWSRQFISVNTSPYVAQLYYSMMTTFALGIALVAFASVLNAARKPSSKQQRHQSGN